MSTARFSVLTALITALAVVLLNIGLLVWVPHCTGQFQAVSSAALVGLGMFIWFMCWIVRPSPNPELHNKIADMAIIFIILEILGLLVAVHGPTWTLRIAVSSFWTALVVASYVASYYDLKKRDR